MLRPISRVHLAFAPRVARSTASRTRLTHRQGIASPSFLLMTANWECCPAILWWTLQKTGRVAAGLKAPHSVGHLFSWAHTWVRFPSLDVKSKGKCLRYSWYSTPLWYSVEKVIASSLPWAIFLYSYPKWRLHRILNWPVQYSRVSADEKSDLITGRSSCLWSYRVCGC